jgi:hypothetical protein
MKNILTELKHYFGLGLTGTFISQEKIFANDSSASAAAIAPVLAVRSAPRFGYFLATTGIRVRAREPLCSPPIDAFNSEGRRSPRGRVPPAPMTL